MPRQDDFYIANLAFLANYSDGTKNDEIEYEIFKVAFQDKETVHYDRIKGGNFRDLEQEIGNIATMMKFTSNIIQSVYFVNVEKNSKPFIVVGYGDITVEDNTAEDGEYLVSVKYRLLDDMSQEGVAKI